MADKEQQLAIVVVARDMASQALKSVSKELGGLDKAAKYAATRGIQGIGTAIKNIERMGVIAGGAALAAGAAAVKMAGDFEQGMNTINTVSMASDEVLAKAGEGIRKVYRETGQDLADLQASEYDLVSAGIKLQDAQGGLETAVRLGLGAYGSTAEAVDVLTTAVNSYNLKAADGTVATATFVKVGDELAQAVADGKVKLSEIAASYADVAAIAAQAKIGTDEIAASYGFLTAKGVPAAEVTTQMSRAILELQKPSAAVLALQKKLKKSYADVAAEKGLNVALKELRTDAEKAGVPVVKLFGRVEGYKYLLQTTGDNAAGFNAELQSVRASAGMMNRQFDERAQGLNYQLGVFKANVMDAGITIGQALIPELVELSKEGTAWIQAHQGDIKAFAKDLGVGFRDAVNWAKQLDWQGIATALQSAAAAGKSLVDAFLHMPPQVQEMLIGLFAANKLTGGAVSDIGGAFVKGFIGQALGGLTKSGIFARGGSPANPVFVADVTGGTGAGPGLIPGKGNLLTGLLRMAGFGLGVNALIGANAGTQGGKGVIDNLLGGGLAGAALGGPLGLIAGLGVGGVKSVAEMQSQSNSEQASQISKNVAALIASNPSLDALRQAASATKTGIDRINALGPLGSLVAGNSVDQLQDDLKAIEQAIKDQTDKEKTVATQKATTEAELWRQYLLGERRSPTAGPAQDRQFTDMVHALDKMADGGPIPPASAQAMAGALTQFYLSSSAPNENSMKNSLSILTRLQQQLLAQGDKTVAAEIGRMKDKLAAYLAQIQANTSGLGGVNETTINTYTYQTYRAGERGDLGPVPGAPLTQNPTNTGRVARARGGALWPGGEFIVGEGGRAERLRMYPGGGGYAMPLPGGQQPILVRVDARAYVTARDNETASRSRSRYNTPSLVTAR